MRDRPARSREAPCPATTARDEPADGAAWDRDHRPRPAPARVRGVLPSPGEGEP